MPRPWDALAWSCAALFACATGPRPGPSHDDGSVPRATLPLPPLLDPDTDADGIPDDRDECPQEAEDQDGFEDADGCPDLDNDHDRIVDAEDRCPNLPETYNGIADDDGCPDRGIVVFGPQLHFDDVTFARGRAFLEGSSLRLVDVIAAEIVKNGCWVVWVTGHASEDERRPEPLSAARAGVVRAALVARGVASEQLRVRSLGATGGSCRDGAESCHARHRRVELVVSGPKVCR